MSMIPTATAQSIQQGRMQITNMRNQVKTLLHSDPRAARALNDTLNRADSHLAQGKMHNVREDLINYAHQANELARPHSQPGTHALNNYVAGSGMINQHGQAGSMQMPVNNSGSSPYARPALGTNDVLKINDMARALDHNLHLNTGIH